MNFGSAVVNGYKRFADFTGRSSRSEYWYWVLFMVLVGWGLSGLATFLRLASAMAGGSTVLALLSLVVSIVAVLFDLASILPALALAVRRLHDVNKSGWWLLLEFTVIGLIPLFIWFCTRGTQGPNRFGDDPLAGEPVDLLPHAA